MKVIMYLVLFIIAIFHSHKAHGSHQEHKECQDAKCRKAKEQLAQTHLQFTVNLYKHIIPKSPEEDSAKPKNILFSPFSISTAFAMLALGAKSETRQQILDGLNINQTQVQIEDLHELYGHLLQELNKPKDNLKVNIGNALFVEDQGKVQKSFAHEAERHYQAQILTSNFRNPKEAAIQINHYVKDKTNRNLEQLVKDLGKDTKLLLVDYVLFKGEWELPFNPHYTQMNTFSVDENTAVKVQMMSRLGRYKIFLDPDLPCTVLQLPYKSNAFMLLVIPDLGKIHEIEQALSKETIERWKRSAVKRFIKLNLPKFSASSSVNLTETLADMGMTNIFTDNADFSGIMENVTLQVSNVFHKVVLEVDEKGTVAAAATAIQKVPLSQVPSHQVDRPFLVLIYNEETDTVLFMGRIINPAEK